MKIAVYSGSFDPITNGHIEILKVGSAIFDKIIIAVANNVNKKSFFSVEERLDLIKKSTSFLSNVEVASYDGLTVDFAEKNNASYLIRGLRNSLDFEYEIQLAQINEKLQSRLKTIFIPAGNESSLISSSMVKEIFLNKGDILEFVPEPVYKYLTAKYDI